MKPTITFVINTYNEEARITNVVKNFIAYGDVILVDSGSTDRTREIAESLGAKYYLRPERQKMQNENQENFDFIKSVIRTNWIYWGHADFIAPKTLVEKLVEVSNQTQFKTVSMPLYTYLWGETNHPSQKARINMFFHKDFRAFPENRIHYQGTFIGTSEQLLVLPDQPAYALRHFSVYNEAKYIAGYMRYAEEEARQKFERGERFSAIKLLAAMLRYIWIYRHAFRSPRLGLLITLNMAFGRLMTYTRLYEHEHGITLDSIANNYRREKEKLLKDFE